MKYVASFKLTNPETKEVKTMSLNIETAKEKAPYYGNGMHMSWKSKGGFWRLFDIRYDKAYNAQDEEGYIKKAIKKHWSGERGSWKATHIRIYSGIHEHFEEG